MWALGKAEAKARFVALSLISLFVPIDTVMLLVVESVLWELVVVCMIWEHDKWDFRRRFTKVLNLKKTSHVI